ncbi:adenylate/guanylate cyclase domain-containing protein [Shimia sp. MMG029]|uniref:adenylate/guanylate cyclase domain-containing protein n=1 Tax=Shimia sp. MMG029 TaxID=3021978 RepID=UPI0022FEC3DA|nr:adenylate/guanylate cyclase domain-containing protein [Shimia sp. MMG029]MDA5556719.1 adenylate/guanylate cyclase domain-containing protein [Shimia sp. MMG029]
MLSRNLGSFLFVLTVGAIVGAVYSYVLADMMGWGLGLLALWRGAVRGVIVATIAVGLEVWISNSPVGRWQRSLKFRRGLALRMLITCCILLFSLAATHLVLIRDKDTYVMWFQQGLFPDFLFAFCTGIFIQFMLQARRLIGGRTLTYFLLGRYARPTEERRIFVLADLKGSTSITEKLGDQKALEMITGFFLDIDPVITKRQGVIHNYVGDEVIMSWRDRGPDGNMRLLQCIDEIFQIVAARHDHYMDKYGVAPSLRMGIAGGPVAVGECGWEKRQVVYIGDTINRAKRLQEACKAHGLSVILDAETANDITLPMGLGLAQVEETTLRGRASATQMLTLTAPDGSALEALTPETMPA